MRGEEILRETQPFFHWLAQWYDALPATTFDDAVPDPPRAALLAADLIVGFCSEGALSSERINAIVPATMRLVEAGHGAGMTRFLFAQDTHAPDTPEFEAWPPHCVAGTRESEMVPALAGLPFAAEFTVLEKNALSAGVGSEFENWLAANDDLTTYIVTGDCTDLCTYNLAMFVRMWLNATNRAGRQVIVDACAVQTYDLPVSAAGGAFPHPGDFTHMYFLYHMALNGIRVVAEIKTPTTAGRSELNVEGAERR